MKSLVENNVENQNYILEHIYKQSKGDINNPIRIDAFYKSLPQYNNDTADAILYYLENKGYLYLCKSSNAGIIYLKLLAPGIDAVENHILEKTSSPISKIDKPNDRNIKSFLKDQAWLPFTIFSIILLSYDKISNFIASSSISTFITISIYSILIVIVYSLWKFNKINITLSMILVALIQLLLAVSIFIINTCIFV